MDDRRKFSRYEGRLKVRYNVSGDKRARTAFTRDVGASGLSIISHKPEKPGTKLILEIELPGGATANLEGEAALEGDVQWQRTVPAGMHAVERGTFGVRIRYASESWYHFIVGLAND